MKLITLTFSPEPFEGFISFCATNSIPYFNFVLAERRDLNVVYCKDLTVQQEFILKLAYSNNILT